MTQARTHSMVALCLVLATACGEHASRDAEPTGRLAQRSSTETLDPIQQAALEALAQHGDLLGLTAADTFAPRGVGEEDDLGLAHARFDRYRDGVPVLGGDVVVHLRKQDGKLVFSEVS